MRPPDQVLRELVAQWVHKAEQDYLAAEYLLREAEPLREPIAFHCQQAAEKYIKAFLVYRGTEFPKTHDIKKLLDLLAGVDAELAGDLAEEKELTPYGVEIRYPSDFPEVLRGGEKELFDLARRTREVIMERLRPFLQDLIPTP